MRCLLEMAPARKLAREKARMGGDRVQSTPTEAATACMGRRKRKDDGDVVYGGFASCRRRGNDGISLGLELG